MIRLSRSALYRLHYSRIDSNLRQPAKFAESDYLGTDQYQKDIEALRKKLYQVSNLYDREALCANQLDLW